MKRIFSYVLFGLTATALPAVLGGCPIYSEDRGQRVCLDNGQCYSCPGDYYSSQCYSASCGSTYDCPSGYVCNGYGSCVSGGGVGVYTPPDAAGGGTSCTSPADCGSGQNCGTDDQCHPGDCSSSGCPSGYVCKLSGGSLQCVGSGGVKDGGAGDSSTPPVDCHNDTECKHAGDKCLDGKCVAPADQCSDATQCPNAEQCVQGVCTPSCDATKPCPTGYTCDTNKVCTGNPTPCGAAADAGTCAGNTTCVEQRCVDKCGAGNTCSGGLVCVDGGCIPDQKPQFACAQEGAKDLCANGSLCLHHSCYIGCDPDAGATACQSADRFNQCKQVQTSSGTYAVCGSATNLGTECDPTRNLLCTAGKVCIDGFCK